jgi:hypothetical protein
VRPASCNKRATSCIISLFMNPKKNIIFVLVLLQSYDHYLKQTCLRTTTAQRPLPPFRKHPEFYPRASKAMKRDEPIQQKLHILQAPITPFSSPLEHKPLALSQSQAAAAAAAGSRSSSRRQVRSSPPGSSQEPWPSHSCPSKSKPNFVQALTPSPGADACSVAQQQPR